MIKANELRIGNLVDKGIISEIHKESIKILAGLHYYNNEVFPIPLSPELLEKCGFEFKEYEGITTLSDDFDDPKEDGTTKNWTLKIPSSSNIEGIRQFELVQFGNKNILFAHNWLRVPIHHLHQLQNLYFALTGSEIEVNL